MKKLGRATGDYDYDLAVDKAIQYYHKHVKVEEEDGRGIMMKPVRGASECTSGVKMFHILLKTTGGQKYGCIYVAPEIHDSMKMEHEALKLVFFRKVDSNVPLPLGKVVRFALALHNKEEKLTHLIRATGQMVADYEIFRMTFNGEFSGESSKYDAIVLVPRKNPEKMELVMFGISEDRGMYLSEFYPPHRYQHEDVDDEEEDGEEYNYRYEGDKCAIDDPRVTAAARFALAEYNETDNVQLGKKKDQVRRVVGVGKRTYSGYEILSMRFDGELDGSWYYEAIVLVPVNDPKNMRLAYCGRNWDDRDPYIDDYKGNNFSAVRSFLYGCEECSIDDPWVTEAARRGLAAYNEKDKLLRVVKAVRQTKFGGRSVTHTVRFVGEDHSLRTYVAMVSVPDDNYRVRYAGKDDPSRTYVAKVCLPREDPKHMRVERVFPEVIEPSRQYEFPKVHPEFVSKDEVPDNKGLFRDFVSSEISGKK